MKKVISQSQIVKTPSAAATIQLFTHQHTSGDRNNKIMCSTGLMIPVSLHSVVRYYPYEEGNISITDSEDTKYCC